MVSGCNHIESGENYSIDECVRRFLMKPPIILLEISRWVVGGKLDDVYSLVSQ